MLALKVQRSRADEESMVACLLEFGLPPDGKNNRMVRYEVVDVGFGERSQRHRPWRLRASRRRHLRVVRGHCIAGQAGISMQSVCELV